MERMERENNGDDPFPCVDRVLDCYFVHRSVRGNSLTIGPSVNNTLTMVSEGLHQNYLFMLPAIRYVLSFPFFTENSLLSLPNWGYNIFGVETLYVYGCIYLQIKYRPLAL